LGDDEAAQSNLAALMRSPDGAAFDRVTPLIQREIEAGAAGGAAGATDDAWHMAFGGPQRQGHMPSLPKEVTAATLSESWFENFDVEGEGFQVAQNNVNGRAFGGEIMFAKMSSRVNARNGQNVAVSRDQLLSKWRSNNWLPAGQMLVSDGLVYYKKHDRIVCNRHSFIHEGN
jgi:hypothetical protein